MIFETGTYVADGLARTISLNEITGTPDFVFVKGGTTARFGIYKTAEMTSNLSERIGSSGSLTSGINAFAAGEFSLGTHVDVAGNGFRYHYIAINDDGNGDFATGKYSGAGGTEDVPITGVGFEPEIVLLFVASATVDHCKMATHAADASTPIDNVATSTTKVKTLDSDGFTVDTSLDASGVEYRWVAFKQVAGKIRAESFVGDGADNKARSMTGGSGVTAEFAAFFHTGLNRRRSWRAEESSRGHSGDDSSKWGESDANSPNFIQAFNVGEVETGNHADVNHNNNNFVWFWLVSNPGGGGPTGRIMSSLVSHGGLVGAGGIAGATGGLAG